MGQLGRMPVLTAPGHTFLRGGRRLAPLKILGTKHSERQCIIKTAPEGAVRQFIMATSAAKSPNGDGSSTGDGPSRRRIPIRHSSGGNAKP